MAEAVAGKQWGHFLEFKLKEEKTKHTKQYRCRQIEMHEARYKWSIMLQKSNAIFSTRSDSFCVCFLLFNIYLHMDRFENESALKG